MAKKKNITNKSDQITVKVYRSTHTEFIKAKGRHLERTGIDVSSIEFLDRLIVAGCRTYRLIK